MTEIVHRNIIEPDEQRVNRGTSGEENQPVLQRASAGGTNLPMGGRGFGSRHTQQRVESGSNRAGSSRENVSSIGPNMSRSALVNSGNAAISGHHHAINTSNIGNFSIGGNNTTNNGGSFTAAGNSIMAAAAYGVNAQHN